MLLEREFHFKLPISLQYPRSDSWKGLRVVSVLQPWIADGFKLGQAELNFSQTSDPHSIEAKRPFGVFSKGKTPSDVPEPPFPTSF